MSENSAATRDERPSTPPLHTGQLLFDLLRPYRKPVRAIPELSGNPDIQRCRPLTLLCFFLPTSSLSAVPPATAPRRPSRHDPDSSDTQPKYLEWSSNRTRAGEWTGSASATFLPSSSSAIPSLAVPDHLREVPAYLAGTHIPLPASREEPRHRADLHASLGLLSCAFAAVNGPSRATPTWPTMP